MRKIYIVPNFVTTANMFAGFYSMIASIKGDYVVSAWAIMAAAVFDMLDGRIARMAKATSQFGVEYDSLSDLVSFGMAPAILLHQWALVPFGRLGWLAAFLFLACGALRLARFNVTAALLPKGHFQGVPIPIAAGTIATFVIFHQNTQWPEEIDQLNLLVLILTFGLASLMVSTLRFPSFKELNWRSRASFGYLMVGVLAMIVLAARPEISLFLVLVAYLAGGLVSNVVRFARKGKSARAKPRPLSEHQG